ncbi:MAG TPA: hypothetical protein V6C72_10870, partial [Chroococcales cyanobacterium]
IASMVDTRVQNGVAPVIIFRDNVQNLSTTEGGKHCGQPLGAEQANWEDLAEYGGTGSKSHNLLLAVFNQSESSLVSTPPVNTSTNSFISLNPKDLSGQTRKSTYGGGLAVAIDIGGIKPSTASRDVASMRALKR